MLRTSLYTLFAFAILPFLVACEGDNTQGQQNSQHGLVNTSPVAKEANLTLKEDNTIAITLGATDVDKDTLGYRVSQQPTHGTLTGKAPELTYRPNKDYNGADSLIFIANDGLADSNAAVVRLTLTPVNDAPVADADTATLDEDTHATIKVLENDSDVDGDTLSIKNTTQPSHGTLTQHENTLSYTPAKDYYGEDSFTYTTTDGTLTSQADVTLAITSVNDAPVAKELNITLDENGKAGMILQADDVDSQELTYVLSLKPIHGTVEGIAPNLIYIPNKEFFGKDSFTYKATDTQGASSLETKVNITIEQVATITSLELSMETPSLNKDTNTSFTLTHKLSKGKVTQTLKEAIANPEFIVTPQDAVLVNPQTNTITALKDTNVTIQAKIANALSNTENLNIYWEVNGHRLPPEPDPKINNATLLGVDSNNNGVRDDVERWIYEKHKDKHPVHIDIAIQAAKVYQEIIEHPEDAQTLRLKSSAVIDCEFYLKGEGIVKKDEYINSPYFRKTVIFNTRKRRIAYDEYNNILSGGSYTLTEDEKMKQGCIDAIGRIPQ